MKKIILFSILISFYNNTSAQINIFIGQTRENVIDYWSTKISDKYFKTWDDGAFTIMYSNSLTPNFIAYFDNKNICISHSTLIKEQNFSIASKIKKAGFIYDEKAEVWKNEKRQLIIELQPINKLDGTISQITLNCVSFKSWKLKNEEKEKVITENKSNNVNDSQIVKKETIDTIKVDPKIIDMKKFMATIKYPHEALSSGLRGTCYLSFIVEKDSTINTIELLRGIPNAPSLDSTAINSIKLSTKNWQPATRNGEPIRSKFIYPIKFGM